MENMNLIDTFSEFKELKNIDRTTMMSVLEDVFRSVLQKQFGTDENFDIIINIDKGDFEIWRKLASKSPFLQFERKKEYIS